MQNCKTTNSDFNKRVVECEIKGDGFCGDCNVGLWHRNEEICIFLKSKQCKLKLAKGRKNGQYYKLKTEMD